MRRVISKDPLGKLLLFAAAALGALLPLPARAGVALIPIASNQTVNGTLYVTKVWVSNQGGAARRFTTSFIAVDANGTQAPPSAQITVAAKSTVLLTNVAPIGQAGMLLVSGAPQLVVSARLEAFGGSGALASANLQAVTGRQVSVAGATLVLQGLARRIDGLATSIHVANATEQAATCVLKAFRKNGQQIQQNMTITVKPLSLRSFEDALGALGETELSDARFTVSCNKPFYAFARVQKPGTAELEVVTPSVTVGRAPAFAEDLASDLPQGDAYPEPDESALQADSELLAPSDVAADGTFTLNVPGEFLRARPVSSFKHFTLPLRPGLDYGKAEVEFDLELGKWRTPLFHGIMGFKRSDPDRHQRVLYTGLILRGSNGFKTILDIGKDPRTGEGELIKSNTGPWRERTKFHLKYTYDTVARRVTLQVWKGAQLVQTLAGEINNRDLRALGQGREVTLDFGMTGVADGAYFPPVGWVYSNLKVKVAPK
ncbi:MAG TPA: hypothetical protein VGS22_01435 [Thermoanaerobaculia bacterium]|jgi:hypothetical protein|nr:hypothetical protein [Thermoanaerobaculia bacterium]